MIYSDLMYVTVVIKCCKMAGVFKNCTNLKRIYTICFKIGASCSFIYSGDSRYDFFFNFAILASYALRIDILFSTKSFKLIIATLGANPTATDSAARLRMPRARWAKASMPTSTSSRKAPMARATAPTRIRRTTTMSPTLNYFNIHNQ